MYASIDLGIDNLAAITSNKRNFLPRLVNGRPIKSINQFYNKRKAELQSKLGTTGTTARIERIQHYLHAASKEIVGLLVEEGIGTLIVGKNPFWKQEVEMGRRNNKRLCRSRTLALLICYGTKES